MRFSLKNSRRPINELCKLLSDHLLESAGTGNRIDQTEQEGFPEPDRCSGRLEHDFSELIPPIDLSEAFRHR